jgi:sugar lactone lactonase YvrE
MARQAFFYNITALAVGSGANLYVADGDLDSGSWVRRVKPDGTVSTLAGSDKVGFSDGKGDAARFYLPSGLAADENGNVYVADPVNSSVRKVTPDGVVTTISAKLNDPTHVEAFLQPSGVAVSRNGALYVLDGGPQMARVSMISPDGKVETLAIVDAKSRKRPN